MVVVSSGLYGAELGQAVQIAAKGIPCPVVDRVQQVPSSSALKCLVIDPEHLDAALAALPSFPQARLVVLYDRLSAPLLAAALREPRVLGFVADHHDGPDPNEVACMVGRSLSGGAAVPLAKLMSWAHVQVAFSLRSTAERGRVVEAVSTIAARFGLSPRNVGAAREATACLLEVLMGGGAYREPVAEERAVQVKVVLDATSFGIEAIDAFGALKRGDVFGALLRVEQGAGATDLGRALRDVLEVASMMRFHVEPGVATCATFLMHRGGAPRLGVGSLYWETAEPAPR